MAPACFWDSCSWNTRTVFHFKVVPIFKAEFPVDKRKMDLLLNPPIQLVSFYWRMKDVSVESDSKRCVLAGFFSLFVFFVILCISGIIALFVSFLQFLDYAYSSFSYQSIASHILFRIGLLNVNVLVRRDCGMFSFFLKSW